MTRVKVGHLLGAGWLRRPAALFSLGVMLCFAQSGGQAQDLPESDGPLTFFKNYFITGNYVASGGGFSGEGSTAEAHFEISGVPPNVDILAAFLYVQTAESAPLQGISGATFNGLPLDSGEGSIAKALGTSSACFTVGEGVNLVTYRADVLRLLPLGENGKHDVNDDVRCGGASGRVFPAARRRQTGRGVPGSRRTLQGNRHLRWHLHQTK